MSSTVPSAALADVIQSGIDDGHIAAAAALLRGLRLPDRYDLPSLILRCYESGRVQEAADALGGDRLLEVRVLRQMLCQCRCLPFALQYATALRELPTPDAATLVRFGGQVRAHAACLREDSSATHQLAEAVRSDVAACLLERWPDAHVHVFGSCALALADGTSDVDVCVTMPSHASAHCRDNAGRAQTRPLLSAVAAAVSRCSRITGMQVVVEGRTPLLRFEFDSSDGRCASVELCINNTNGLANTAVFRHLMVAKIGGVPCALHAVAAFMRHWARRRGLCGVGHTLNAYSWNVLSAFALQQATALPIVQTASDAFASLVEGGTPECWQRLAVSSLAPNPGSGIDSSMLDARLTATSSVTPHDSAAEPSSMADALADTADVNADHQLGLLVWHCFTQWAFEFPYRRRVVSLRDPHGLSKDAKGWTRRDEQALMIEDPVETGRDLGKHMSRPASHALRLDAALALFMISDGAALEDICAPSDWRLREHAPILGLQRIEDLNTLTARAVVHRSTPTLITTLDDCQTKLLPSLTQSTKIGLDCEGEQLSRSGRLCLVQICTEAGEVFLVDALAPDGHAMLQALRPSLESEAVLKVLHDCRRDAESLLHQHSVRLARVFDTQVAFAALVRHPASSASRHHRKRADGNVTHSECAPLAHLVSRLLVSPGIAKDSISAQMSDDASFWTCRPLRASQTRYAAADVAVLLPLHARLVLELELLSRRSHPDAIPAADAGSKVMQEVQARSDAYLRVRDIEFAVERFDELHLHMLVPGVVANVSRFGLFVQIADGLTGLVGTPELCGEAPSAQQPTGSACGNACTSVTPTAQDQFTAIAMYRIAQRVQVRIISLRSSSGRQLVGLSLHGQRMNPSLQSHAAVTQGSWWGRVLLVEDERAVVSLELPQPYELLRTNCKEDTGDPVRASLKDRLVVGQLLRVTAAAPSGGRYLAGGCLPWGQLDSQSAFGRRDCHG